MIDNDEPESESTFCTHDERTNRLWIQSLSMYQDVCDECMDHLTALLAGKLVRES